MSNVQQEIWKAVKDYEGIYEVSNLGRIKSLVRIDCKGQHRKERIISQGNDKNGYKIFTLSKNRVGKSIRVHRLIAETFIPNPENKEQINHIDRNVANNYIDNLEWCSLHENLIHKLTVLKSSSTKGILNYGCKLTEQQVLEIFNEPGKLRDIVKKFGINKQIVSRIKSGYTWSFLTGKKSWRKTKLHIHQNN